MKIGYLIILFVFFNCTGQPSIVGSVKKDKNKYSDKPNTYLPNEQEDNLPKPEEYIKFLFDPNKNKGHYLATPVTMSPEHIDRMIHSDSDLGYSPTGYDSRWGKKADFTMDELKQKANKFLYIDNSKDGSCELRLHTFLITYHISLLSEEDFEETFDLKANWMEEYCHNSFFQQKSKYNIAYELLKETRGKDIKKLFLAMNDHHFNNYVVEFFMRHVWHAAHNELVQSNPAGSFSVLEKNLEDLDYLQPKKYGMSRRYKLCEAFENIMMPLFNGAYSVYDGHSPIQSVCHKTLPHVDIAISKDIFNA